MNFGADLGFGGGYGGAMGGGMGYGGDMGGAGYMPHGGSPAPGTQPANGSPQGGRSEEAHTCIPVTLRTLIKAREAVNGSVERLTIHGKSPNLVTCVAKVQEKQCTGSTVEYTLNDCTGVLVAEVYIATGEPEAPVNRNQYVRVVATIRGYAQDEFKLSLHCIRPAEPNELAFHMADAARAYMLLTVGPKPVTNPGNSATPVKRLDFNGADVSNQQRPSFGQPNAYAASPQNPFNPAAGAQQQPPPQQFGAPAQPQGGYASPAPYGAPAAGGGQNFAPPQQGYGAPQQLAPAPQQGYGAPPPQQGYGAPPPQQGYGAPPPQQGHQFGAAGDSELERFFEGGGPAGMNKLVAYERFRNQTSPQEIDAQIERLMQDGRLFHCSGDVYKHTRCL